MRISIQNLSARMRIAAIATLLAVLVVPWTTASAVSSHANPAAIKHGGTMTISWGPKGSWTQNFNPYSGTVTDGTLEMIYEPLFLVNLAQGGRFEPWLATSYRWANHNRKLTFYLRHNVRWNDGKPFTSADVSFSFYLAKKYPSISCGGCWQDLSYISTPGQYTVVFHFKTVNTTMLYYLGSFDPVPKHVWAKVNPSTYTNPNPVATGPYKLGSFQSQVFTLVPNKYYWQAGKPYVSKLVFPAYSGNDSDQAAVVSGAVDWAGLFIPNAGKVYASKSSNNHYWFYGGGGPVSLWLNDRESPFNNVHVRKAIAYAIDRKQISRIAESGYAPTGNAGFVQPQLRKTWGNRSVLTMLPSSAKIKLAKQQLRMAHGVNLSKTYNLIVIQGWTDWDAAVAIIAENLSKIGMKVNVEPLQFGDYVTHLQQSSFDMALSWMGAGPSPYYVYEADFVSSSIPPKGGASNFSGWHSGKLDALMGAYSRTSSFSKQVKIMKQAEAIVASKMPIVPVFAGGDLWDEYSTKTFTGWPNPSHPYDLGSPYSHPSNLDVILHVHLR